MTTAYPLQWPTNWPRTKSRSRALFKTTWGSSVMQLMDELRRMEATHVVLSTNLSLRRDGLPYANGPQPEDVGAAVYFMLNGQQQCIPCDRWDRVEHNIRAIGLTVAALRGLDRWGAKETVNAAFRGFAALPHMPSSESFETKQKVQHFADCVDKDMARGRYLRLVKELHPDMGGSVEEFQEMKNQYEKYLKEAQQ